MWNVNDELALQQGGWSTVLADTRLTGNTLQGPRHSPRGVGCRNLRIALGWSGGGGNDVAVDNKTGARTYMKMGTLGIGLGIGGQKHQMVFLFQEGKAFRDFVYMSWEASASAQTAAGTEDRKNRKQSFGERGPTTRRSCERWVGSLGKDVEV